MFNIGDVVKIVNNGSTYSTYGTWIDKNCKEYKKYYVSEASPNNGDYGIIRCLAKHGSFLNEYLALVQMITSEQVYVIGVDGLRKTDKATSTKLIVDKPTYEFDYIDYEEREEENMNKVLKLYYDRKREEIDKKYEEKVDNDFNNIDVVKQYKTLIENFEKEQEALFKTVENFDNDYLVPSYDSNLYKYSISELKVKDGLMATYEDDKANEIEKLKELVEEVDAQLSLSDDLNYQMEVLTRYDILDKKTNKVKA